MTDDTLLLEFKALHERLDYLEKLLKIGIRRFFGEDAIPSKDLPMDVDATRAAVAEHLCRGPNANPSLTDLQVEEVCHDMMDFMIERGHTPSQLALAQYLLHLHVFV